MQIFSLGRTRYLIHIALSVFTVLGLYIAHRYIPYAEVNYVFTIGFAYISLTLLAVTLFIGPINFLIHKYNPVNIDLRRDVGIWTGITGCLHVIFGLSIRFNGNILPYFFQYTPNGKLVLLTNRFGYSNFIGLIATLVLIVLLLTSNTLLLRKLKGKRWKLLQRFNYVLFMLVVIHTLLYQQISRREQVFQEATFILIIAVFILQLLGIGLYNSRKRQRLRGGR